MFIKPKLSNITAGFQKMLDKLDEHNRHHDGIRTRHANNIQYAKDEIKFSQGQIDESLAETNKALRIREKISGLIEA